MALYRGMDIGTAKPSREERLAVPHHLVDVLDCDQEFSLAQYVEAATRQVESIRGRGREVLFVGGTPLYLKGLLRGIFQGPPADWTLRHRLEAEAGQSPPGWLHRRLMEIDPAAAARLHPNDTRRLIRAIEVYQKTGRPISHWQQQFTSGRPAESGRVFVLDWDRQELYARIDRRVDAMFAAGLVERSPPAFGRVEVAEPVRPAGPGVPGGDPIPRKATGRWGKGTGTFCAKHPRGGHRPKVGPGKRCLSPFPTANACPDGGVGQSPHAAICQAAVDLVSQSQRVPPRPRYRADAAGRGRRRDRPGRSVLTRGPIPRINRGRQRRKDEG